MIKKCIVPDCNNSTRSNKADYCEKHYYRLRRNRTTDTVRRPHQIKQSGGYILIPVPSHPLVKTHTGIMEYAHRVAYYDAHGDGPFICYWCGKTIDWQDMHIDHLNEIKTDNHITNLVASCPLCNQKRGRHKMVATIRTNRATWIEHDGKTMTMAEWADMLDISRVSLKWRLDNGWSVDRALTEPRGKTGPMSQRERHAVLNAGKPVTMQAFSKQ